MTDWRETLDELYEIRLYFKRCWESAGRGTVAAARFQSYIDTLVMVREMIRERLREEDDGR